MSSWVASTVEKTVLPSLRPRAHETEYPEQERPKDAAPLGFRSEVGRDYDPTSIDLTDIGPPAPVGSLAPAVTGIIVGLILRQLRGGREIDFDVRVSFGECHLQRSDGLAQLVNRLTQGVPIVLTRRAVRPDAKRLAPFTDVETVASFSAEGHMKEVFDGRRGE